MTELLGDRYEPLEVIGAGGEGRVLRALDRQHDRLVALKVRSPRTGTTRPELLRETRVLLSLEPHAGLPLVRDDFFHEDDYVIVMDWIEGTDLGRLLAEQGTPGLAPSTVLRSVAQAAEALTFLHSHDPPVVHGDVKPANLILTERGRIVLADFGVASKGEWVARAGTPGFVAPEVAAGDARLRRLFPCHDRLHAPHGKRSSRGSSRMAVRPRRRAAACVRRGDQARHRDRSLQAALLGWGAGRAPARGLGSRRSHGRGHRVHDRHRRLDGSLGDAPGGDAR